ncbi:N-acetylmuramoyl-L-alanine amidase [Paenibacillus sp. DMB20]|uniref:N-acetylmuramoyl-L-alanine amidase n=1 Tax=Paenibacillus sp. DMB20 TaxID=1642570 RepID=UPI000627B8E8|nr:N-acetylmuramoyl-L-alanine amidase [Paenibacillus sp. DMB20]KKO55382.1 N-acetylmuramoyl-L-alanine amidase [Paenibacillus sp. DMB20]
MKLQRIIQWKKLSLALTVALLAAAGFTPGLPVPFTAAPSVYAEQDKSNMLQEAFESAAEEFGVPVSILMSVSYNLTRWEHHHGEPSTSGGFGIMHLTDLPLQDKEDPSGIDDEDNPTASDDPSLHTLSSAARLLNLDPDILKQDPVSNIRGGAALLAQYAQETLGKLPASESDWYGAVAKYSGSPESGAALEFADHVFETIQQGISRQTPEGQVFLLQSKDITPNPNTVDTLHLRPTKPDIAECPRNLHCSYVPAAYQQNGDDPSDYSNYDLSGRPQFGPDIRYVVIHNTEETYQDTIDIFTNPNSYVSAHYVLRSSDGQITQMVKTKDVPWHAGNWYFNMHSIGLEHEGFAMEGATWFTERLYRSSAALVRYLAKEYDIPLDRAHIIGHNEIPGLNPARQGVMHQDPGPFWDWEHYMELVGAPIRSKHGTKDIVTIKPDFKTNQPEINDAPAQPSNFLYLYKEPDFNAELIDDPALVAQNKKDGLSIGAKAAVGQTFSLADKQGDWTAIWFGGQKAWFYNPQGINAVSGKGMLITPKAGAASIPVYGAAYPEAAAYPADITPQVLVPLQYTILQGQSYVAVEKVKSDYYNAPVYTNDPYETHTLVKGKEKFYRIYFNHRFAFVKAADVEKVRKHSVTEEGSDDE